MEELSQEMREIKEGGKGRREVCAKSGGHKNGKQLPQDHGRILRGCCFLRLDLFPTRRFQSPHLVVCLQPVRLRT